DYHLDSPPPASLDRPDPGDLADPAASPLPPTPPPHHHPLHSPEISKNRCGTKPSPVRVLVEEAHDSPQENITPPVTTGEVEHQEVEPHTTVIRPATDTPLQVLHSTTAVTVHPTSTTHLGSPSNRATPECSSPNAAEVAAPLPDPNMLFGHIHTFGAAAARRRVMATSGAITPYEADLTSKDRAKQKDAVKRFLVEHVRTDWKWEWPPKEPDAEGEEEAEEEEEATTEASKLNIDESTVWRPRDEWISDLSEPDDDSPLRPSKSTDNPSDPAHPHIKAVNRNPFKFESPDSVGDAIGRSAAERKRRRQRRLVQEMEWNPGVRCFIQRRDAWTGARKVARASKLGSTRRTSASLSGTDGSSTAVEDLEDEGEWYDEVEIPIPRPLLPPTNVMRASITPAAYNTIYDKVIIQALTPSCPMNLKDVTRSCVQGWKRDGEWPPRPTPAESVAVIKKKGRKLSVAGILGLDREKDKEKDTSVNPSSPHHVAPTSSSTGGSGIRRSLQRVLGLGKEHASPTNGNEHGHGHGHNPSIGNGIGPPPKVPDAESAVVL
ncbi:hypothetical protein B7463_g10946, partial [Scytalidium lignicola]